MARILVVGESPAINSGFANVLRRLNEYFISQGHEVEQLAWCHMPHMKTDFSYKIHPVKYPDGGYYGQELFDGIVHDFKPDIVFTLGDVYMVDWIPYTKTRSNFTWVAYTPIDSAPIPKVWGDVISAMDFPVTYSKFGKHVINKQVDVLKNPVRMIYHGIDTSVYYPMDKKKIREKNNISEDAFILLYVGVNSTRKQLPRLIEAFDLFARNKEDVMLYLHTSIHHNAGKEGWFLKEILRQYKDVIPKVAISKRANPISGVSEDEMRKIYSIADVFVSATQCEGFGLPFVEAAACGVPSLAVKYSSIPELITGRGETVAASDWMLHTPYCMRRPFIDIKDFASKMGKMYNTPSLRLKYSNEALKFAKTMDWENILPLFGKLIVDALAYKKQDVVLSSNQGNQNDSIIDTVVI